jgi:hypothetical protein
VLAEQPAHQQVGATRVAPQGQPDHAVQALPVNVVADPDA